MPITVTAPQRLLVGELGELIVGVGARAGVAEIAFTVQFDADVLQVRAGTQGSWAVDAGTSPRFVVDISSEEDRVRIRSAAAGQRSGMAGGSVAIVQFQALAPGTTSVLITDVVVRDSAGKAMASAVSGSNLQVTVDSLPARPTAALSR
ncbi:MAG TPA: cohesin domain-containing protein [Caldimonas sp.]|nr:cohesin domain-containing protein [Caldimonas sp.]HEX2541609.1 cohesin domain-containing protein [Caldimonas sp.]